ncbi:MAG: ABC transporter ATP-binding protein [Clostridia bacterium]|nr:ABC transporter ATP-binding protein [Clostridia bacterium]MDD3832088.1 ABC transporter ATP-binding protein [Clostridia bacterium]
MNTKSQIGRLLSCLKGYRLSTVLCPLFLVGEVVLEIIIPYQMSQMVNLISTLEGNIITADIIWQIVRMGLMMIMYSVISLTCGAVSAYFASKAGVGFATNIRREIFDKVQSFSFANIDAFSTSSLITRCTTDIVNVQNSFIQILRTCTRSPLMFILAVIMSFKVGANVAWIFLLVIPILLVIGVVVLKKAFPLFQRMLGSYDELNSSVQENLIGIRVVKSFVREDYEYDKFNVKASNVMDLSIKAERVMIILMPAMQFLMYVCRVGIVGIGGTAVMGGTLLIGSMTAMLTFAIQILNSLLMLTMVSVVYITSKASIGRICEVLDTANDMPDGDIDTPIQDGSVVFENVSFAYNGDNSNPVLTDINLTINGGETVGIIGGTGEGKSSLVQLIPRLYEVSSGSVKVGGIDVRNYTMHNLRESVAMVLQKNVLFSGTIMDNLRWGNPNATFEQIQDACERAQADSFIRSFPDGYNTVLGQGGVNVSGGQKQRICIARALLKNPRILILDDSTSAVDMNTDRKIREAFMNTLPNTTKIIIAQRIASVMNADKIIVLDEGKVVSVGTHEQLLATNHIYQEVYYSQTQEVAV